MTATMMAIVFAAVAISAGSIAAPWAAAIAMVSAIAPAGGWMQRAHAVSQIDAASATATTHGPLGSQYQTGGSYAFLNTIEYQLPLVANERVSFVAFFDHGTVSNRITKLEGSGVIVGYTVKLKPDSTPNLIVAWMSILIEGNDSRRVIASLLGEPGVAAIHGTNGRWDLLAELRAEHLAELSAVLDRIRLIKGISNTETSIHLSTYKA